MKSPLLIGLFVATIFTYSPHTFSKCSDRLAGFTSSVYVEKTASTSPLLALGHNLQNLVIGGYTERPALFVGMPLGNIGWARNFGPLYGSKVIEGWGQSHWGTTAIRTNIDSTFVEVIIRPEITNDIFTGQNLAFMKETFPQLQVKVERDRGIASGLENSPTRISLKLLAREFLTTELFEENARSLVNTIFNDPYGLLGVNPPVSVIRYSMPRQFRGDHFIPENWDFFGNFGKFKRVFPKQWEAKSHIPELPDASIRLSLDNWHASYRFDTQNTVESIKENVRRIAWTLLTLEFNQSTQGLPWVRIGEARGVTAERMFFDNQTRKILETLEVARQQKFPVGLVTRSPEQVEFIKQWMNDRLNQTEISDQNLITVEDIVNLI